MGGDACAIRRQIMVAATHGETGDTRYTCSDQSNLI